MSSQAQPIKDKWIWIFVYPVMALLVVHIGNDNSIGKLVTIPSYYTDILLALICTYCLGFYYAWLFRTIDQRFDWGGQVKQVITQQLIFGVVLPTVLLVSIEIIYLKLLLNINLANSSIFYLELPVMLCFCAIVNLLYSFLYFKEYSRQLSANLEAKQSQHFLQNLVIRSGVQAYQLPVSEVAYVIVRDGTSYVVTKAKKQYLHDVPLSVLADDLSPSDFFQLNRQVLAHRQSIVSATQTTTRKLEIKLEPALAEPVFVSKGKATAFRQWLEM